MGLHQVLDCQRGDNLRQRLEGLLTHTEGCDVIRTDGDKKKVFGDRTCDEMMYHRICNIVTIVSSLQKDCL